VAFGGRLIGLVSGTIAHPRALRLAVRAPTDGRCLYLFATCVNRPGYLRRRCCVHHAAVVAPNAGGKDGWHAGSGSSRIGGRRYPPARCRPSPGGARDLGLLLDLATSGPCGSGIQAPAMSDRDGDRPMPSCAIPKANSMIASSAAPASAGQHREPATGLACPFAFPFTCQWHGARMGGVAGVAREGGNMAPLRFLLCRFGRHQYVYTRVHWYGHLVGRCRRCGHADTPELRRRVA
jgi:hypothetical protein